jgi:hypothetical protein
MHARIVLLLALLGSVALAGAATSAPPPERFCGLCTDDFGEIAAENDIDATVAESALDIRVFANGSTRWTERVALRSADGGAVEADRSRLDSVARSARGSRWVLVDDPGSLDVAFDGRNLTATYWVEGATTERVGGVVLFEGFHAAPYWNTMMVADRITVTGPAGTVVGNRVPGASIEGRTVEWTRSGPSEETYVAFARSGGLLGAVVGSLAVGTAAGPSMVRDAVAVGTPAAVAVLVLAGVVRLLRRDPREREWRGHALSTLAVAASVGLSLAVVAGVALGLSLGFVGVAAVPLAVVGLLSASDRRTTALAGVVTLAAPVAAALAFVPVYGFGIGFHTLAYSVVVALATAPILLGYAGRALLRRRAPS